MENKAKRIYSLDIIRIIATACILFHHYQQNLGLSFDRGINFYFGWFYFGNLVELFFVMSGFFIYRDHNKIKKLVFGQWFSKKYLRFIPLVALSVIVYEILVVVYVKVFKDTYFGSSVNLWGAVITALGIQDGWVFRNPVINNPVWYISVLLLCYLIFYIIITVSNKYKISPVYGFIIMILVGCSVLEYRIDLPFLNFGAARGYYSFFSGGVLACYLEKHTLGKKHVALSGLFVVLLTILIVSKSAWIENGIGYILTFCYFPALIILFMSRPFNKVFNHHIIGKIGVITFDVYIWHVCCFMVVRILVFLMGYDVSVMMSRKAMVVYAVVCFFIGTVSHYLIERPINRKILITEEKL